MWQRGYEVAEHWPLLRQLEHVLRPSLAPTLHPTASVAAMAQHAGLLLLLLLATASRGSLADDTASFPADDATARRPSTSPAPKRATPTAPASGVTLLVASAVLVLGIAGSVAIHNRYHNVCCAAYWKKKAAHVLVDSGVGARDDAKEDKV